jgi:hypothetical protein
MMNNPFTPKSGIEPRYFIGREQELDFFKKALRETERGMPSHFIVLGEWGCGKTSLLREFKQIAQAEGSLCSMISVRDFEGRDTLRNGIEYLVGEIAIRLPLDVSKLQKFTKELSSLGISIAGTGFQFAKDRGYVDPQTFFYSNLLNLWDDLKKETKVLVVLIDDIQNFSAISSIMMLIRQVLTDEKINKETKLLFVLASTYEGWKPFLQRNHPIGRYFTPRMKLENLSEGDTTKLIQKYLKKSGVSFSQGIMKQVYGYTQGHLYETHVLCSKLFDNQMKGKVTKAVFEPALNRTLETLGEEVFDNLFESASQNEQLVLRLLAEEEGLCTFSKLGSLAQARHSFSQGSLIKLLNRLIEKRIISRPERAVYSVKDVLFRTYVLRRMSE